MTRTYACEPCFSHLHVKSALQNRLQLDAVRSCLAFVLDKYLRGLLSLIETDAVNFFVTLMERFRVKFIWPNNNVLILVIEI